MSYINIHFCSFLELCSPHHFSSTGLEPCSPCPPLTYQQYIGQRKCFPCGNDTMFAACAIPVSTTSIDKASNTDTSNTNIGPSKSSSHYYTTGIQVKALLS